MICVYLITRLSSTAAITALFLTSSSLITSAPHSAPQVYQRARCCAAGWFSPCPAPEASTTEELPPLPVGTPPQPLQEHEATLAYLEQEAQKNYHLPLDTAVHTYSHLDMEKLRQTLTNIHRSRENEEILRGAVRRTERLLAEASSQDHIRRAMALSTIFARQLQAAERQNTQRRHSAFEPPRSHIHGARLDPLDVLQEDADAAAPATSTPPGNGASGGGRQRSQSLPTPPLSWRNYPQTFITRRDQEQYLQHDDQGEEYFT